MRRNGALATARKLARTGRCNGFVGDVHLRAVGAFRVTDLQGRTARVHIVTHKQTEEGRCAEP